MRNQLFKFIAAAFVSNQTTLANTLEPADFNTYDDPALNQCVIETSLRDYVYPFDGLWPWLKTGLNYHITGRYVGQQVVKKGGDRLSSSDIEELLDNDIEFELAPLDVSFDVKIWTTKNKFSVKYFRDEERTILATHVLAELEFPSMIYKKVRDLEMQEFDCDFEILDPGQIALVDFVRLLWTPTTPPAMWYMGETCMDEEHQEMLSLVSDDMSGLEYIIFFDKHTKKAVKAYSGITNRLKAEAGELHEFIDENGNDMTHLAPQNQATFEKHEVVHSFTGDPDFWVDGCMTIDGSYEYKFKET